MNAQEAVQQMVRAEVQAAMAAKTEAQVDAEFQAFKANVNVGEITKNGNYANGLMFARVARAMAGVKGDKSRLPEWFREVYKDPVGASMVEKTLSNLTPGAGGYLVAEHWASELIPLLRAQAVVMKAGARMYPMPNAIEHIPSVTAVTAAYWIADTAPIPVSQPTFSEKKMIEKYLVGMTPISNNLIRSSSVEADAYIREDITRSLALKLDYAALLGSGTNGEPLGIWGTSGITQLSVNAAVDQKTPIKFRKALLQHNVDPRRAAWVFHPDIEADFMSLLSTTGQFIYKEEMMTKGTLLGFPYFLTTQIPVDGDNKTYIFLGDFNELLFGDRAGAGLTVDSSMEAAWVDGSGNLSSAYQTNVTLIRARHTTDVLVRQPVAFVACNDAITIPGY